MRADEQTNPISHRTHRAYGRYGYGRDGRNRRNGCNGTYRAYGRYRSHWRDGYCRYAASVCILNAECARNSG